MAASCTSHGTTRLGDQVRTPDRPSVWPAATTLCDAANVWLQALVGTAAGLLVLWLVLLVALWRAQPDSDRLREAARLLPDVLRLIARLARDGTLPRGVRLRLWLLLGYLALPVDVMPDFLPVVGYADDAVLVVWTLRSVSRRAGENALAERWPGTAEGLQIVERLAGLSRR